MGNGAGRITGCFAGGGDISGRHDIAVMISDPTDEGLGYAYFYIRPEEEHEDGDDNGNGERTGNISEENDNIKAAKTTTYRAISGASFSANNSTPLSTSLAADVSSPYITGLDRAATFESSTLFSSIPLQRGNGVPGTGPVERGFVSGPIERGPISDPGPTESESSFECSEPKAKTKKKGKKKTKPSLMEIFKSIVFDTMKYRGKKSIVAPIKSINSAKETDSETTTAVALSGTTTLNSSNDETEELQSQNLQWAQGKAGEDRVHVVVSEEHGRVFVGIYDGFNGPDAPDYLLTNLYSAVDKELKGLLGSEKAETTDEKADDKADTQEKHMAEWKCEWKAAPAEGVDHGDVLGALSRALQRTEDAFLERAAENPELALMGSCVLVMLMKGEDVYLMHVGDSRAVLARKCPGLVPIGEETAPELELSNGDAEESGYGCELSNLTSLQLTMDHSTNMEEEVARIKRDHPNDPSAVLNERVKGYLKVTRAFGAGFLKQPKWNEALLEMFRIEYVGTCPYLTCAPSLRHHKLTSKDRFLILSSDGLYQYFTNEQAVSEVELFIESFPEGDPAQHLIEQVLFRAARKAGMDFNELLDIPIGERRRYHDDISIIIISLEGRIWRSSV